jgi:hypothetical protein
MNKTYFRYKVHPGDFFRNTDVVELPNPEDNLEQFLIWFLHRFQSDQRIAEINDLSKLTNEEFGGDNERMELEEYYGKCTKDELLTQIAEIENELKAEANCNFYELVLHGDIEIIQEIDNNETKQP